MFRDALGVARLRADHTITNGEAQRALRAIETVGDTDAQRAAVRGFLASRAAGQLSARAADTLRAFIARGGAVEAGDSALTVRGEAARETRDARARMKRAEARLDALLSGAAPTQQSAAQLKAAQAALAAARADVTDARALLLRIGTQRGVRAAARALGVAALDLDEAGRLLGHILARSRGVRVKRSEVEAVKRWLLAPTEKLAEAEAQLARAPRGGGGYTTAKAPSDSEDQGATPPPLHPTDGGGTTARSALERMRRALAGMAAASTSDDDEDDP